MSKYYILWNKIKSINEDEIELSFDEIEEILGFSIDHSFLTYKKELAEFGYQVGKISMKDKVVCFEKDR